jgi:transcriptional regulator with XRE-family HTH domain
MAKITLQTLGRKIIDKRGEKGIRETAKTIGISHGTLSRLERGHLPDLETFAKVCKWLRIDPAEVLGVSPQIRSAPSAAVHCRKDQVLAPATAQALAHLILAAHRAVMLTEESGQD